MAEPPQKLLLSFYGDDFTGSTDAMEALALHGIKTVLFLDPPESELLQNKFPDLQAFGVAGISRSLSPIEMEQVLPPIFQSLRSYGTPVVHYKICSTFDSSHAVGSIGKAMDIAAEIFPRGRFTPLLVGVPALRRYTVFGYHYAGLGDAVYRLDQHPVMANHPVTPMGEADLRRHLSGQTSRSLDLFQLEELNGSPEEVRERWNERLKENPDIVLFDVLDNERLGKAGALIWEEAQQKPIFAVGSSGIEYALVEHWKACGLISNDTRQLPSPGKAEPLVALSGSCSPVTKQQLEAAFAYGFQGIRAPIERLLRPDTADAARRELLEQCVRALSDQRNVVIYSALGPEDETIATIQNGLIDRGLEAFDTGRLIGQQFGKLCGELIERTGLRRIVVAGGDTSGYVTKELGIYALEVLAPIAPGGPLCRAFSDREVFDGLEITLKGGQVGKADYFIRVLNGC
ncbi:four-carbon acid sugar kinase family protein [Cohnella suwonensis]|uniref:Four-carbon acid sugar kinase family protein n=1 Tax=Cohnella suwonensis TaxID=696072 RepID=A0ABW0M061_9BACL